MKVTEWFMKGENNPSLPGVYEVSISYSIRPTWFQNWNGRSWGVFDRKKEGAYEGRNMKSLYQDGMWRGLAEDPSLTKGQP